MHFSRWLLWILLLGCGPTSGKSGPIVAPGGLPVDIAGNKEVSLRSLRSAIAAGDMSSPEAIAISVTGLYFNAGFVDLRVQAKEDETRILVQIVEGDRFAFGSLQFTGAGRAQLPSPTFKSGEVFASNSLRGYIQTLEAYFAEQEIEATVRPLTDVDRKKKRVNVTFEIQSNDPLLAIEAESSACAPTPDIGRGEALVLRHDQEVILGPERPYHFSRICVRDLAAIRICSSAEVRLSHSGSAVIGGAGVGSSDTRPANFTIRANGTGSLHALFDTHGAPLRVEVYAPRAAPLVYAVSGARGLTFGATQVQKAKFSARHPNTSRFPHCN